MSNKYLCSLLLSLFLILILIIINNKNYKNNIENFESNEWTTDKNILNAEKAPLNEVQKTEVKNMVESITNTQLKTLISTQSPLLVGPQGPPGQIGPSGTTLIASGRLVNKNGSFNKSEDELNIYPKYVVTRTEGTNKTSSLSYMDNLSPFASFQNWQLDINNNLKNRYDGNCLTMDKTLDKLYIDKCDQQNPLQKWNWDNTNRLISPEESNQRILKCIGLTKPENNVLTTNLPGCSGTKCMSDTPKRYLVVKDCDINNINEDEVWAFV
jgi:hypothetical protein